jgi:UPF0716 protein FxsA
VGSLSPVPLLVLLFIVVPLAELYVIIRVGEWIGVLPTIALLLADGVLGAILLRSQGRAAWRRFNLALAENRVPAREVFDGAMVIFGGALLLTPGFVTDVVGLLLLIPPTRALIRRTAARMIGGRFAAGGRVVTWGYGRARDRRPRRQAAPGYDRAEGRRRPPARRPADIEGTAEEVGDRPPPAAPGGAAEGPSTRQGPDG